MEGRLGGLFKDDKQIGGLVDWEFELLLADASNDITRVYKFAKWRLNSRSYWLFEEPDIVTVRLYVGKTYWEGDGKIITRIEDVFDTMVHKQIEIIGEGSLNEH